MVVPTMARARNPVGRRSYTECRFQMPDLIVDLLWSDDAFGHFLAQELAKTSPKPMDGDLDRALRQPEPRSHLAIAQRFILVGQIRLELVEHRGFPCLRELALQ